MYAFVSCADQSTTAPAWPRVSLSSTTGCKRIDKQPLEISQDTVEDKKQVTVEKLTPLGWICFRVITLYLLGFVKEESFVNEVIFRWQFSLFVWSEALSVLCLGFVTLLVWIDKSNVTHVFHRSGKRWGKYFQN